MSMAVIPKGAPWQKNVLTVAFVDSEPFSGARAEIRKIANEWSDCTGFVKFAWIKSGTADIRIGHRQVGAYWSMVGNGAESIAVPQPTMNLGFSRSNKQWHWDDKNERRRLILHEFGHALGLDHEHKHPDSKLNVDAAVDWYRPYFPGLGYEDIKRQFERYMKRELDGRSTEFDPDSIMLYSFPADIWPPNGIVAPSKLSVTDITTIMSLYRR